MSCPYCKGENLWTCYSAELPLLTFACPRDLLEKNKSLPFEVRLCEDCLLGFASQHAPLDDIDFLYANYDYTSALNKMGTSQYEKFIRLTNKYCAPNEPVLEIGCLEGYVLKRLQEAGFKELCGVEPSPKAREAKQMGFQIYQDYFREGLLQGKQFGGIVLMHVFEHFPDPFMALHLMRDHLSDDGKIIMEVPNFTGFQHEHLYYFSPAFIRRLARDRGFSLVEMDSDDQTLRYVLSKGSTTKLQENTEQSLQELKAKLLYDRTQWEATQNKIVSVLAENPGESLYWWGSGMGSVVLLNQIPENLRKSADIKILDGDARRWGMFIPGVGLEVESYETLKAKTISNMVIASSFHQEILQNLKSLEIKVKNVITL